MINGNPLELVLVKNPSGFRLGLKSFDANNHATMIAINDNYADGRDMSWLWDVDFQGLANRGVDQVSGIRAYDMALRLWYDEVPIGNVDPDLKGAIKRFVKKSKNRPMRIYCTYTAMLSIRKLLSKITKVEAVK
jgi:UDP-N-acetylmuramyl tripeptide synthase